ncbi:META domain-containing protein [Streptomyces sp. NRRL S-244]|uniref:META domain-containing protein n=1 Tax=Streptomyces sp. NRRL S-244 TaxID=1463897 RepID=UPI0004C07028|nr:META domain-containing protein [Streptomyces sp. NRRL S-244]
MRTLRHLPAALVALLTLAAATACSDGGGTRGTLPGHGSAGTWFVQSLTVGGKTLTAPSVARVTFPAGGPDQATGNYGCNGFTAEVTHDGASAITVKPGSTTAMACENTEFETAFAKLLTGRLTVDRQPDRLTLKTADGSTIAMSSEPPAPDAPLTTTTWTVTSLVSGQSAASLPAGAAGKAVFTIGADLAASGSLGCNRFSAKATGDGAQLTFGPLTTTRMACEGPAGEVERKLTELFAASPLTWRIKGGTLTLTAPDGTGLTATAASAAE